MFHLWFNTFFIKNEELILRKEEVDKANKDKKCKVYDKNFMVEVQFARLDENGVEIAGRQRSSLFVSPGEVPAAKYQPPSAMSLLQEQMYVRARVSLSPPPTDPRWCTHPARSWVHCRSAVARRLAGLTDENGQIVRQQSENDIPAEDDENLSDDDDDEDSGPSGSGSTSFE